MSRMERAFLTCTDENFNYKQAPICKGRLDWGFALIIKHIISL